jgi:sulfite exporter TauE/SafE
MPVNSPAKALPLGFVWGWLPCGLVYSVLAWAFAAGSVLDGALLMLAFGVGTLPALLLMGAAAATLTRFTRDSVVKRVAGFSVVLLGLLLLWRAVV